VKNKAREGQVGLSGTKDAEQRRRESKKPPGKKIQERVKPLWKRSQGGLK